MTPDLETSRLLLRPLELDDATQIQPLFARWEIVRELNASVPWPYPPDGVEQFFREVSLPAIARGDEWYWTLRLKTAPEQIIGALSLSLGGEDNRGFWLGLPWQGRGLMTEAVLAANRFWFEELRMPVLRAPKAVSNNASRRVSEKTGMRMVARGEKDFVSGRHAYEVWEMTAEDWGRQCENEKRAELAAPRA